MPSGTTSLPIPSPGIAAIRCFIEALRALSFVRNGALAYQESATRHTRVPVFRYLPLLRSLATRSITGRRARASRPPRRGVVMPIMRVSDPTFEGKRSDNRVIVRFRVNRAPDQSWIGTFKGHASASVLRAANAVFNGNDVTLDLVRPKTRAEL